MIQQRSQRIRLPVLNRSTEYLVKLNVSHSLSRSRYEPSRSLAAWTQCEPLALSTRYRATSGTRTCPNYKVPHQNSRCPHPNTPLYVVPRLHLALAMSSHGAVVQAQHPTRNQHHQALVIVSSNIFTVSPYVTDRYCSKLALLVFRYITRAYSSDQHSCIQSPRPPSDSLASTRSNTSLR